MPLANIAAISFALYSVLQRLEGNVRTELSLVNMHGTQYNVHRKSKCISSAILIILTKAPSTFLCWLIQAV